jgi:hypothetical protein
MTYLYSGIKVTSENNNFQLSNAKLSLYTYFQKHTSKISWKLILLLVLAISFQLDSNAQSNITTNDNGGETIQSSPAKQAIPESDASIKEKEKQASKQKEALKENDALKNTEAYKEKEGAIKEKEAAQLKEKNKQEQKRIADTKSLMPYYLPFPVICIKGSNAGIVNEEFSKFNDNSFTAALVKCNGLVAVNFDEIKNNENQTNSKSIANPNMVISKQAKALIDLERRESIESLYQLQLFIQNKVELDNLTYIPLPLPNKELIEKEKQSYLEACHIYVSSLLNIVEFYPFIKDKYNQIGVELPSSKTDFDPIELVSQLISKIQTNTKQ